VRTQFRVWQRRVLVSSIFGYALFYFVRQNLPMAMPAMHQGLNVNYTNLGKFLTAMGLLYGVSKFANGYFGDRANARAMMVVGLAGSAVVNLFFGFGSSTIFLGVIWMINGWFQGMGYPPCARLITNWFSPKELAMRMSTWNLSHQIGGGLIAILCGYLAANWGWRSCFFVPAILALIAAAVLWRILPDTPPSVGLPEVEGTHASSGAQTGAEFNAFVLKRVFSNKYVWLASFANFFVYTIRYAVFNWGPTMLTENKHLHIEHAGWMVAGFEWVGGIGALFAGWLTDRFCGGRAMRVGLVSMILTGVSVFLFWRVNGENQWLTTALLCAIGFFIYGPQCLVAVTVANLSTKRAAATAVGLTSVFGYASTVLSGWGLGWLAQNYGWDAVFKALLIVAGMGVVVFAASWPAKPHGYND
jgi:OPA family glycerol-3-phosphate transporter-like MFS transporter/OPA family sugar phosphate sensor protein UhpC-like MFS transporter